MDNLFAKMVFLVVGGCLIATAVSGNCWPVIIAVAAMAILAKVFGSMSR
jgi:hypothetical protein